MSEGGVERRIDLARTLAERAVNWVGGNPAVVRLQEVFERYDRAGGGLVAAGLAYTSLLALLPGLLLAMSVVGLIIRDPATQEQIVNAIAQALPPFEELARLAFGQVSAGAVPTSIIAIAALFWGASRFYANLDTAFSRIFLGAPRRNPVIQTVRGVLLTIVLVLLPVGLAVAASAVDWLAQFAPDVVNPDNVPDTLLGLATPVGSLVAFTVAVAMCYRFVPSQRVPWRALIVPAVAIGVVLAVLTQIYAFIVPRLMGLWAVYGTVFAILGLLAWLSIAFNVLLVGAAWTEVRQRRGPFLDVIRGGGRTATPPEAAAGQPADAPDGAGDVAG